MEKTLHANIRPSDALDLEEIKRTAAEKTM